MKTKAKERAMEEEQEIRTRKREKREAATAEKKDGVNKAVEVDQKRSKMREKGGAGKEESGRGEKKKNRLKTEEMVEEQGKEEEEEAILEAMAKDGAWYAVNLSFDGTYLRIHYQGYSTQDDEKWNVNSFKNVQGVFNRLRLLSDVMQDCECKRLTEGTKICAACRRPHTDKFQYYDAIVKQVTRSKHTVNTKGEEECHCSFVVAWQKGPLEGKTSKVKCGDICFLRSGSIEEDSTTQAFLQAVKHNCTKRSSSRDNDENKTLGVLLRQTKLRKLNLGARERKVNLKEESVQCVEEMQPILPVHISSVRNKKEDNGEGVHWENKLQMTSTGILDESSQSGLEAAKNEINKNKVIQCVEKMQLKLPDHIPLVKNKKQYDGEGVHWKSKFQASCTGILDESSQGGGLEEAKDKLNKNESVQCVVETQSKLPDHKYDCEGKHRNNKLRASSTGILDESSQGGLAEAKNLPNKNKAVMCLKERDSKLPDHIPPVKNKERDGEGVHLKNQLRASSTGILDELSQGRLDDAKDELNQNNSVQCVVEMQSKPPDLIPYVKNKKEDDGEGVNRKNKLQAASTGILDESLQSGLEETQDELNKRKVIQCVEEMQPKLPDHIPSVKHQKEYDGEGVHQTNKLQVSSTRILDESSQSTLEEAKDELNKNKAIQRVEEIQKKLPDHIPSVENKKEDGREGVHWKNKLPASSNRNLDESSQSGLEEAKDGLKKKKTIECVEEIQSKLPDHIPSVKNKKEYESEGAHWKNKLQSSSTGILDEPSQSRLEEAKDELNKNKAIECVEEIHSKLPLSIPSVKNEEEYEGEGAHRKNKLQYSSTAMLDKSWQSRLEAAKDELNKNKTIESVEKIRSRLPASIPSVKNKKEYEGEGTHRNNKLQYSITGILDESSQSRLEEVKDELNKNKSLVQCIEEIQSKLPDHISSVKNKDDGGEGALMKNHLKTSSIGILDESSKSRLEETKDELNKNKPIQCMEELQSKLPDHIPTIKNKKDANGEGEHQKTQLQSSSTGIPDESLQSRLEEAQHNLNKEDEKANDGIIEGTEDKSSVSSCTKMPMQDEEVQPDINCRKSNSVKSGIKDNASNPSVGGSEGREETRQVEDGSLGIMVANCNTGFLLTATKVKSNIHVHSDKSDKVIDLISKNETSGKILTAQNIELPSTVSSAPVDSRHNQDIAMKVNSAGNYRYVWQKEFPFSSPIGASKVVVGTEMKTLPDELQQTRKVIEQGGTDQTMRLHQTRMVSLPQESSSVWGFKESQAVEIIDLEESESLAVERAMDQMQIKVMAEPNTASRCDTVRQSSFDSGIQQEDANERQGCFRSQQTLMKCCVVSDTPTAVSIDRQPPVKVLKCSEGTLSAVTGDDRIHCALNSASNFAACNGKEGRINARAEREPVYSQIVGQCSSSSPSEGRVSRVSLIEDVTYPNNERTVQSFKKCCPSSQMKSTCLSLLPQCCGNILPQCCGNSSLPCSQYVSSSQVLMIENMERDVNQAEAIKVLMGISSGLSSVFILPCLEYESWGKGYAIYVDTSSAEKAYSILNGGNLFIVSSEGRPWAVSRSQEQLFDLHLPFGSTSTSPKDQSVAIGGRNRSLHVASKGSIGFEHAKAKAKRFMDHKNELQLCHKRYKIDEKKAQGIFVL